MKTIFSIIYIVLIIALAVCTAFAKRSSRPSRGAVAWLETSLMVPLIANLFIVWAETRTLSLVGYYIHFISVNGALVALVNFTNAYCTGIGDGKRKPTIMYVALGADTAQLLLNPAFGHVFDVEKSSAGSDRAFDLVARVGYTVHSVIGYGVLMCVLMIFTIAAKLTPKIYREKFTVLLISMVVVGGVQAYYIIARSDFERTVIGYGFFGIVLFYFAICYRPLRLLDQLLSKIISDLPEAFYVFDPNGKCLWANEQGRKLVGSTDEDFDDVVPKLIESFGDPSDTGEPVAKKTVGEGEEVRYYMLEEKRVGGENGVSAGSYLRIRDLTDEEREIKARGEQIGKLSQEAYRDSLTGVGSKAAYSDKIAELNSKLAEAPEDIAIVMVDMNDLKRINDEHGHKFGDIYIKGCCHMICEAFKHSPVFRIGGDEFVAILRGRDFDERTENVARLRDAFDEAYEQTELDPWLRYSAAVGMSEYAEGEENLEKAFKRADSAMYAEKKALKALRGSYR